MTYNTRHSPATQIVYAGVPEDMRSYSSVHANDAIGTGHARSEINSDQAWSAGTNEAGEWLQMDLGEVKTVVGTVIQPRSTNYQYVTSYTVSTSEDGNTWKEVSGDYDGHGSELNENIFSDGSSVQARYVRMIVQTWTSHISMRADVLVAENLGTRGCMLLSLMHFILYRASHFVHFRMTYIIVTRQILMRKSRTPECLKTCAVTAACTPVTRSDLDTPVRSSTPIRPGRRGLTQRGSGCRWT